MRLSSARCEQKPSQQDVPAADEYFHVSEGMVETLLKNKGRIERDPFMEMAGAS